MPNQETLPSSVPNSTPDKFAGLTPEQQRLLAHHEIIDPAIIQTEGNDAMSLITPQPEYAQVMGDETSQPDISAQRLEAEEELVSVETRALDEATQTAEPGSTSAYFAAEAAEKKGEVEEARHKVEDIFGSDAEQAEEEASVRAIRNSTVSSENDAEIARAMAAGESPVRLLEEGKTNSPDSVRNLASLKDKVNGRADTIVDKVAEHSREEFSELGLRGVPIGELEDSVLENNGGDLTKAEVADAAENEAVGGEVIHSVLDNKPSPSKELSEVLEKVASQPDGLPVLRAIAGSRNRNPSAASKRVVGKGIRRTHHYEKAA
jgi:hypothetical protein